MKNRGIRAGSIFLMHINIICGALKPVAIPPLSGVCRRSSQTVLYTHLCSLRVMATPVCCNICQEESLGQGLSKFKGHSSVNHIEIVSLNYINRFRIFFNKNYFPN